MSSSAHALADLLRSINSVFISCVLFLPAAVRIQLDACFLWSMHNYSHHLCAADLHKGSLCHNCLLAFGLSCCVDMNFVYWPTAFISCLVFFYMYEKSLNCALLWHQTFLVLLSPAILCSFAAWGIFKVCHFGAIFINITGHLRFICHLTSVQCTYLTFQTLFFISCMQNEQGFYLAIDFLA